MKPFIYSNITKSINDVTFEVVETKGKGHPDNICDTLAEKISSEYSKYCLSHYNMILRHMVDKITILGGGSKVAFGKGEMVVPIKVLINGRFTSAYGNEKIEYMDIVTNVAKDYFKALFPLLDVDKYLLIIDNTHVNEGPGVIYKENNLSNNDRVDFFIAKDSGDTNRQSNNFRCNDTSTTVSYAPMSMLEKLVLSIEQTLNADSYKELYPFVGNDIKVMGIRKDKEIEITACVPLIAKYTNDINDYYDKLDIVKKKIIDLSNKICPNYNTKIFLNTRDNIDKDDLYLTAIGSAIESGDEGAVGRGNRSRGVIPFTRHFSMEAPCGKNPVYHTGKLFTAIGDIISDEIYNTLHIENIVYCTSKMGDSITEPWNVSIEINSNLTDETSKQITDIVQKNISNHYDISLGIINGKYSLNSY